MNLRARAWIGVLFLAGLISCGKINIPDITDVNIPGVYRLDIQQGNVISAEDLARLEIGMTKGKVSHLIGTPAVRDVFHKDRWDYVYSFQKGGGKREQRAISVFFEREKLARIKGDTALWRAKAPKRTTERVVEVPPQSGPTSIIGALNPWSEQNERARASKAIRAKRGAGNSQAPASETPSDTAPRAATAASKPEAKRSSPSPDTSAGNAPPVPVISSVATPSPSPNPTKSSLFKRLSERFRLETVPPTTADTLEIENDAR